MLRDIIKKIPLLNWMAYYQEASEHIEYVKENCLDELIKAQIVGRISSARKCQNPKTAVAQAEMLEVYMNKECAQQVIDKNIHLIRDGMDPSLLNKIFTDSEIVETIEHYKKYLDANTFLISIDKNTDFESAKRYMVNFGQADVISAFLKYKGEVFSSCLAMTTKLGGQAATICASNLYELLGGGDNVSEVLRKAAVSILENSEKDYYDFCCTLRKYYSNHIKEFIDLLNQRGVIGDYKELRRSDVYAKIENSNNPKRIIEKIYYKDYSSVRDNIQDDDVRNSISYNDMNNLVKMENFIHQIHKERKDDHRNQIVEGFYSELNRAIAQGGDLKQKISYVKQYCEEVRKKLKENTLELMVVTSGS